MKGLIQRVQRASVTVGQDTVGKISRGMVVFIGIAENDSERDVVYLADKIINLRIFSDEKDKLNLSVLDIKGGLLLISQFTLLADTRKGRRPSFIGAAVPDKAESLFNAFTEVVRLSGLETYTGRFRNT